MKATCPKDSSHNRFVTVVHMTEDWVVNEHGEFQKVANSDGEIVAGPNRDNTWACQDCGDGTEAIVTD
jgi:hypothetical protein